MHNLKKHFEVDKVFYWEADMPYVDVTVAWSGWAYLNNARSRSISINFKKRIRLDNRKYESVVRTNRASSHTLMKYVRIPGFKCVGAGLYANSVTGETLKINHRELMVIWETPPEKELIFLETDHECDLVDVDGTRITPAAVDNGKKKYYLASSGDDSVLLSPNGAFEISITLPTGMRRLREENHKNVV